MLSVFIKKEHLHHEAWLLEAVLEVKLAFKFMTES